jgi:hypothetical protein
MGISLKAVQWHLKKKMKETVEFYEESAEKICSSLKFGYSVMDELFTFVGTKSNRYYVWAAMVYTQTNRPFYFYRLCEHRNVDQLFEFETRSTESTKGVL